MVKEETRKQKGSVLVFAMLVLSMLLSIAVSSMTVVIATKNSSRSTEKSALAFQIADGAAENVLKRVYQNSDATLNALEGSLYGTTTGCSGGVISGTLFSNSGTYTVKFLDNDGSAIACGDNGWRVKLVRITATGTYVGTTRAIDVGVKP